MTRRSRFVTSVAEVISGPRERNNPTFHAVARCRERQVFQLVCTLAVLSIAQGLRSADGLGCQCHVPNYCSKRSGYAPRTKFMVAICGRCAPWGAQCHVNPDGTIAANLGT